MTMGGILAVKSMLWLGERSTCLVSGSTPTSSGLTCRFHGIILLEGRALNWRDTG